MMMMMMMMMMMITTMMIAGVAVAVASFAVIDVVAVDDAVAVAVSTCHKT